MTDAELKDLILSDPELVPLAKIGSDDAIAKALVGRLGAKPRSRIITTTDVMALFGWTRGGEILAAMRAKEGPAMEVARALDRGGLDAADASAADFWQTIQASDEEKAALVALGQEPNTVSGFDVSRALEPLRPDGKVDPTKIDAVSVKSQEVQDVVLER